MFGKVLSYMGIASAAASAASQLDAASAGHGNEFQIQRTKKEAEQRRKAAKKRKADKIARRRNRR